MSDDYARVLNIVGLAFNLVGILILFRWGMPFRVVSHGVTVLSGGGEDARGLALDHLRYLRIGGFGFLDWWGNSSNHSTASAAYTSTAAIGLPALISY